MLIDLMQANLGLVEVVGDARLSSLRRSSAASHARPKIFARGYDDERATTNREWEAF